MTLCDVKDDGDYKLVIADTTKKLKIYMGTNVISNKDLGEMPVAVETFYDSTKKPSKNIILLNIIVLPYIAVASGSSIFYFQNFKSHMKFDLPLI